MTDNACTVGPAGPLQLTPQTYRDRGHGPTDSNVSLGDLGHSRDTVNVTGTLYCLGIMARKSHVCVQ